MDWTQVDFWWGDERYVPADSSDRNDRGVELDLLDVVGADPARVHAMPAADEAHVDVAAAAAAYGQEVRTHGGGEFDLVLLGLGPDGHVASLFPGFPQLDADDIAVPVTGSPEAPARADHADLRRPQPHPRGLVRRLRRGQGRRGRPRPRRRGLGARRPPPAASPASNRTWWLDQPAAGLCSATGSLLIPPTGQWIVRLSAPSGQ